MKTEIWVVTHKKYKEIDDELYRTIHVGRSLTQDLGYVGDNTGDNISEKNKYYCELTGMYWLWKNYSCDIIGICHYRRFFIKKERLITKEYIEKTLKKYDIIVPQSDLVIQDSVKEQYYDKHCGQDWEVCRSVIREKYPEYMNAFEHMESSRLINKCNMIITSKEIFDQYCEWLFDILFEVEKRIDIDGKDDYQKRVMGFLSERMLKVWLLANNYRVKEQEIKQMESDEFELHSRGIELKRQLFRKMTKPLVDDYIREIFPILPDTSFSQNNNEKFPIWMCWWQGEENAPELVKKCIEQVKMCVDNNKAQIHIVTLENCMDYVTFSPQIIDKFNAGKISMSTLSDRLGMELLYRYGGLWIDATYYIADSRINEVIERKGFYTQKAGYSLDNDAVVNGRWTCDFMKGDAGFSLFGFVMQAFDEYYSYKDDLIEHFMLDYFIEIAYDNLKAVCDAIDACDINNMEIQFFMNNGNRIFRKNIWDDIVNNTWLYKLSYKADNRKSNFVGEETYYGYIMKK